MRREVEVVRKMVGLMLVITGLLLPVSGLRGAQAEATDEPLPEFQHAQVQTETLHGPLADEIRRWASASGKARWLGYAVPVVNGEHMICCSNYSGNGSRCAACNLEGNKASIQAQESAKTSRKVNLEGALEMAVMVRAEGGKISRIREFSMDCVADAGGLDVIWLEGVAAGESVAFLEGLVVSSGWSEEHGDSAEKGALVALALHGDASADRALQSFVSPDRPEWLRKEAAFWLGEARGPEGFHALQKMAKSDPSTRAREQVTFALSVSREPGALAEMIRMAHEDEASEVRGQALFWLAQKAGRKAEDTITGAIQNDPDTEVKKKAVFALSQMPRDEGVPKLIEVAQSNGNFEVRKQAMFWLGQSHDPRALAFFEKILAR
jgi:HEAT repeat protein